MQETLERLRAIKNKECSSQKTNSKTPPVKPVEPVEGKKPTGTAYKINSARLQEDLWLVFGEKDLDDGLVTYFPEEIAYLKKLPPDGVAAVHSVKKVFRNSRLQSVETRST